jgi:hypothetical protein
MAPGTYHERCLQAIRLEFLRAVCLTPTTAKRDHMMPTATRALCLPTKVIIARRVRLAAIDRRDITLPRQAPHLGSTTAGNVASCLMEGSRKTPARHVCAKTPSPLPLVDANTIGTQHRDGKIKTDKHLTDGGNPW